MNAVEIEEAVSELASKLFDSKEFPFEFLAAFGAKETSLKRLRKGDSNASDVSGGILWRNNIHLAVVPDGGVADAFAALRASSKTTIAKAKFVLATDGQWVEAEDLQSGETIAGDYANLAQHFGFFLPLAGISTVREIKNNPIDIKATGRLNRLYVELLKDNPDWATSERRPELNHFMARLIFCFFAEDTGIFRSGQFTATVEQMSHAGHGAGEAQWGNTHEVLAELFKAMDTPVKHEGRFDDRHRKAAGIKSWADPFPYVNGNLFAGDTKCPRFSRIARTYLLRAGELDWKEINPDIFGSMIQAVADDEERGELGMHYTSVPNILKVLNPLFLDDLRRALEDAGDNGRKLLNLRNRMARIRVFDPACGSGNFLVIAYKEMRAIEAVINQRRGEPERKTEIPLTNFRGIELRDFPAEIARLALIIAEYQADVLYRGQMEALTEFLPLNSENWITCGNALRLDWLSLCPPTGKATKIRGEDLFETPLDQVEIDFENAGGETYLCGNPPYKGTKNQTAEQKDDLLHVFGRYDGSFKVLDYVTGWFVKGAEYISENEGALSFVSTNSICQGNQVPLLWPLIFRKRLVIGFAHTSFKWANLASNKAGVTVIVIGLTHASTRSRKLFIEQDGAVLEQEVANINAYLTGAENIIVEKASSPQASLGRMVLGNQPYEGGHLILERDELEELGLSAAQEDRLTRKILGSTEVINGGERFCLWIEDKNLEEALSIPAIAHRVEQVRTWREKSDRPATKAMAARPHQFCEMKSCTNRVTIVPIRSSENREYLPASIYDPTVTVSNLAYAIYDGSLRDFGLISSRLHLVWISAVCGKLETRFSYSNKMGWNTFPLPKLTEQNRADLTRCAGNILLAREAHFPATIADLYDPEAMPEDLRRAHEENDEVLERIYIGRRFRNDTERLEKLFELYTKMTGKKAAA